MYFKVIGIIVTVSASTLIGLYFSKALVFRLEDMKQLKKILVMLRGEVKYSLSPLPDALEEISNRSHTPFKEFLSCVARELKKFNGHNLQQIWNQAVEEKLKETYLKKEDLTKLKQLGETLGYLDKEMQLNTIDMYLEQLNEEIKYSVDHNSQSEKLYKNLGVLGGILIAIVLI
jgi:stage III sporulation protein AB